jgi:enediyne biosynthesis protein E4
MQALSSARGCAFGDFDNDGRIDILINSINDVPQLLRCESANANHWIKLKLIGTKSNRSAIGARVRCVTGDHQQVDEVRSGGSYYSQNDLRIHFGLGKAARVDLIEVRWPNGRLDTLKNVSPDRIMTIREGQYGK